MSSRYQTNTHQVPGRRPSTLAGYLALQREADLTRSAARSHPSLGAPVATSTFMGVLSVHRRVSDLLSRVAAARRPAPATAGFREVQSELPCCA